MSSSPSPSNSECYKDLTALRERINGSNRFATDLYRALGKVEGNMITSPLSLELVLALALTGAKGKTAGEIAKVIHAQQSLEEILKDYSALVETLQSPALIIATQMFVDETMSLKPKFNENANKYFKSGTTPVDFQNDCESARQQINKWVEDRTNNKIREMLSQGILDACTQLVLVNAIHFKASWNEKFNPKLTKKRKFHVALNKFVFVDMMFIKGEFYFTYSTEMKSRILKMEHAENKSSMVFILPNEADGLNDLESNLCLVGIYQSLLDCSCLSKPEVTVQIPRFKIETTVDLNSTLQELGIVSMFSDKDADFTELSDSPLKVSKVIQKAFVEVNEEGAEAAVCTAGLAVYMTARPGPQVFVADHPFVFVIYDCSSLPVFVGRVSEPPDVDTVSDDKCKEL